MAMSTDSTRHRTLSLFFILTIRWRASLLFDSFSLQVRRPDENETIGKVKPSFTDEIFKRCRRLFLHLEIFPRRRLVRWPFSKSFRQTDRKIQWKIIVFAWKSQFRDMVADVGDIDRSLSRLIINESKPLAVLHF